MPMKGEKGQVLYALDVDERVTVELKYKMKSMEELRLKANEYAEKNVLKVFKEALADAYSNGYLAGYNDCLDDHNLVISDSKTEFVDLGLSSGTLWANDYKKVDSRNAYLTYIEASKLDIPTEEQCDELFEECRWITGKDNVSGHCIDCIGPNGKSIRFHLTGYKKTVEEASFRSGAYFWVNNDSEGVERESVKLIIGKYKDIKRIYSEIFMGYRLPVRLVKTK